MRTIRARRPTRRPRASLEQLRTFLAVSEWDHVTRAAQALGMSQGSVSAVVQRLEQTLGVPLFHRIGRTVQLTDAGRDLRPLAAQVLSGVALIEQLPQEFAGLSRGEVAIASGRLMGAHRLSGWLAPFIADHPQIAVHITLAPREELVQLLLRGNADLVVTGDAVDAAGVESLVLERTDVVLAVATTHPLAGSAAPLRELGHYRLLQHEAGSSTAQRATALLPAGGAASETVVLEEGALRAALLAGLGYAAMPRAVIQEDVDGGRLRILNRSGRPVRQAFTAARRTGPHMPAARALWEHFASIALAD